MSNNVVTQAKSNRQTLVLVLLVFAIPSAAALLMYITGWRPSATQNHGELIQPVRPVADRDMQTIDGKTVKFSETQGKWTMVYFDTSSCTESCMKKLYFMRQIHHSQGKSMDRIQRLFIVTDPAGTSALKGKLNDYPDMLVWTAEQAELSKLKQHFGIDGSAADMSEKNMYLIDPRGNLMMRYLPGTEPAGMRKDLERLLKYSADK
jgi:cytochrome oxidase Cu insertion factor (SCO1/SenC/PrrC family)